MAKKIKIPEGTDDNKHLVFDLMKRDGVKSLHVEFNGEGDSGQIEDIVVHPDGKKKFLNEKVSCKINNGTRWSTNGPEELWRVGDFSLKEVIESVCYLVLEREYGGWENNDGAYGSFLFEDGKVSLEMNTRYTEVNTENKVF